MIPFYLVHLCSQLQSHKLLEWVFLQVKKHSINSFQSQSGLPSTYDEAYLGAKASKQNDSFIPQLSRCMNPL